MMDYLKTLEQLFAGHLFEIPDYQRGYAWSQQQWEDLLDDLASLPAHAEHFTGLIVLQERPDLEAMVDIEGSRQERVDVVDGQQRLTTLVLLLDAVRRAAKDEGFGPLGDGIEKKY